MRPEELDTSKQRLSYDEMPDRPCGRPGWTEVCYSGARNVGLEIEMPQTTGSADPVPELKQERAGRNRHRTESPDAEDFHTPMTSISRLKDGPDSRERMRSKMRSRTVRSDRHTGPRTRKTVADTDNSSSEPESFATARRSKKKGTDQRPVSILKKGGDPDGQKSVRRTRPPPMPVLTSSSDTDTDDYIQSTQPRNTTGRALSRPSGPNSRTVQTTTDGLRMKSWHTSEAHLRRKRAKSSGITGPK